MDKIYGLKAIKYYSIFIFYIVICIIGELEEIDLYQSTEGKATLRRLAEKGITGRIEGFDGTSKIDYTQQEVSTMISRIFDLADSGDSKNAKIERDSLISRIGYSSYKNQLLKFSKNVEKIIEGL